MVSAVPLALWVAVPCVPCGCVLSAPLCDGLGMRLRCGCVPCEGAFRCAVCVRCAVLCPGRCVAGCALCCVGCVVCCAVWHMGMALCASLCVPVPYG
ncbi:hypothetical protein PBI_ITOS_146 [Mycobacterium phage Itos]|nr:hypothetical protein PBI_ITOS_146 [Mycobacterium phage Itos]